MNCYNFRTVKTIKVLFSTLHYIISLYAFCCLALFAIEMFCLLNCTLSVTEIQLCKGNAYFPVDLRHYCMQPAFHSPNPKIWTSLFRPFSILASCLQQFCLAKAMSFTLQDDLTKLADPSEWLQ